MAIHFHNEDVTTSFNKTTVSEWLNNCIQDLAYKTGEISIIFCSDDYLLDINKKYLNHDYFTARINSIIDKSQVNDWHNVRNGTYSVSDAEDIFDSYFDGTNVLRGMV